MSKVGRRRLAAAALVAAGVLLTAWTAAASPARHAAARGPVVTIGSTDLGNILIDGRGRTLYLYTPDKKSTSTCYGQCASFWPPLLTSKKARAAHGVKQALLGTTKRKDGKLQVTYAGHPLYFFAQDAAPGDLNGQGLQNIWYAVDAAGKQVTTPAPPATIQLAQTSLGSILTDSKGMTLYLWKNDTSTTSNCYGQCAANWPALTVNGKLRAGPGLQSKLLGTTQRTDGTTQVTYSGHPLYYYVRDAKAGDVNGQAVGKVWYVLGADGNQIGA